MVHHRKPLGAQLLCFIWILQSLRQSCSATPGAVTTQANTNRTCLHATKSGQPYRCYKRPFNFAKANSTDVRKNVCCLGEISISLSVSKKRRTAVYSANSTVKLTATLKNLKDADVLVTNLTIHEGPGYPPGGKAKYLLPLPAGEQTMQQADG